MTLVDAIQQFQAIVYEVMLGDNSLSNSTRDELTILSRFLTKELGSNATKALKQEATTRAKHHLKSYKKK